MNESASASAVLRHQVDRRQLQEIISGLAEGILLLDPQEGIVWANPMALTMHDVGELADLGVSAEEYRRRYRLKYRNNHVLSPDQYPLDRLLAGDTFHDIVVEVSKADANDDDWRNIQQLRGLTLKDGDGQTESLILIMQDVTERFEAEERFERTFGANPAPAIICRLSDLRYVKVNQGFLAMTGYRSDDLIGRSTYEVDVLENAVDRDRAVTGLREGTTIPQMEAMLKLPGNGEKSVIVSGQPIQVAQDDCMLFTFIDMEARRQAENALRQSEERFARSFRLTPVPTLLSTREGSKLLDVNDAFVAVLGYPEKELVGRSAVQLPIWVDAAAPRLLERELATAGSLRNLEVKLRTRQEEILDCLISAETVTIQDEECALTVIQDITERKRTETELTAAIEAVMQDTSWFSRTIIEKLATLRHPGRGPASSQEGLTALTARELEVLALICQGLTDPEIAHKLGLTRNTVRNHLARIYNKADVHSRSGVILWAHERGFDGTAKKKGAAAARQQR